MGNKINLRAQRPQLPARAQRHVKTLQFWQAQASRKAATVQTNRGYSQGGVDQAKKGLSCLQQSQAPTHGLASQSRRTQMFLRLWRLSVPIPQAPKSLLQQALHSKRLSFALSQSRLTQPTHLIYLRK